MTPIQQCIRNRDSKIKSIWIMRQAGRYLPEFRKIREKNTNFINLCLNDNLIPDVEILKQEIAILKRNCTRQNNEREK